MAFGMARSRPVSPSTSSFPLAIRRGEAPKKFYPNRPSHRRLDRKKKKKIEHKRGDGESKAVDGGRRSGHPSRNTCPHPSLFLLGALREVIGPCENEESKRGGCLVHRGKGAGTPRLIFLSCSLFLSRGMYDPCLFWGRVIDRRGRQIGHQR